MRFQISVVFISAQSRDVLGRNNIIIGGKILIYVHKHENLPQFLEFSNVILTIHARLNLNCGLPAIAGVHAEYVNSRVVLERQRGYITPQAKLPCYQKLTSQSNYGLMYVRLGDLTPPIINATCLKIITWRPTPKDL